MTPEQISVVLWEAQKKLWDKIGETVFIVHVPGEEVSLQTTGRYLQEDLLDMVYILSDVREKLRG